MFWPADHPNLCSACGQYHVKEKNIPDPGTTSCPPLGYFCLQPALCCGLYGKIEKSVPLWDSFAYFLLLFWGSTEQSPRPGSSLNPQYSTTYIHHPITAVGGLATVGVKSAVLVGSAKTQDPDELFEIGLLILWCEGRDSERNKGSIRLKLMFYQESAQSQPNTITEIAQSKS